MSVQYDITKIDQWLSNAKDHDGHDLASVWLQLAFFPEGPSVVDIPPDLYDAWVEMSLWEKQAVLYRLIPEISRIAGEQARELDKRARIEEPL